MNRPMCSCSARAARDGAQGDHPTYEFGKDVVAPRATRDAQPCKEGTVEEGTHILAGATRDRDQDQLRRDSIAISLSSSLAPSWLSMLSACTHLTGALSPVTIKQAVPGAQQDTGRSGGEVLTPERTMGNSRVESNWDEKMSAKHAVYAMLALTTEMVTREMGGRAGAIARTRSGYTNRCFIYHALLRVSAIPQCARCGRSCIVRSMPPSRPIG